MIIEDEAKKKLCHMARSLASQQNLRCAASECMAWESENTSDFPIAQDLYHLKLKGIDLQSEAEITKYLYTIYRARSEDIYSIRDINVDEVSNKLTAVLYRDLDKVPKRGRCRAFLEIAIEY